MNERKFNRYLEIEGIQSMKELLLDSGQKRIYVRNACFLNQGQKSDLIGYVSDGAFRHLIVSSDGTERIAGYSFAGDFITSFPAFMNDFSAVTVQAIRRSTVYTVSREELKKSQTTEFRMRLYETALTDVYGRLLLMHAGTPEDRYVSLMAHYPAILEEVSLREIASYLRMAPETLSRLRKKIQESQKP